MDDTNIRKYNGTKQQILTRGITLLVIYMYLQPAWVRFQETGVHGPPDFAIASC